MQNDVKHIVDTAKAVSGINKATGRHFKEIADKDFPALLVLSREFKVDESKDTSTTIYDGWWHYPTVIYGKSNARDDDDFSDYTSLQAVMSDFLTRLLADAEWEVADLHYYEATLSGKEVVAGEVELKKFDTKRFL